MYNIGAGKLPDHDVYDELGKIYERLNALNDEITKINRRIGNLEGKVEMILKSNQLTVTIVKYVVLPLIVILGGLVGVKILLPFT